MNRAQTIDRGFSLVESLVALVLLLVVMGAVFGLVNPSSIASRAQPEAIDVQQRARVAADALQRDLSMSGAGPRSGPATGSLINHFAAVVPRRMGLQGSDAYNVARSDAITIYRVAAGERQTTLLDPLPAGSVNMTMNEPSSCPARNGVCGLAQGMSVVVFDDRAIFDRFSVTQIVNPAALLQPHQSSSTGYAAGAIVAEAESDIYWHNGPAKQLRHYDGYLTDVPVVDNVVGLGFAYFGDPAPPVRPKPPLGTMNCLYDAGGNLTPGLVTLAPQGGSLAELPLSMLSDGPWCGAGDNRFDADLLRVRRVRVSLRIQATQAAHRGAGADYANAGFGRNALAAVPDYSITFDIAPRNLNPGR
jgi:prepilin-type N-terminal cleavage/methylation domain-containing protein